MEFRWPSSSTPTFALAGDNYQSRVRRRLTLEPLETRRLLATFVVLNGNDHGPGSLRDAVASANLTSGLDTIHFDPGIPSLRIALQSAELLITESVELDASNLPQPVTIDATGADPTPGVPDGQGIRVFRVDDGNASVNQLIGLQNIRLTGGDVTGDGGALLSMERLNLVGCELINNSSTGRGGGLALSLTERGLNFLLDLNISGNTAFNGGGAMALTLDNAGTTILSNAEMHDNASLGFQGGGGIYAALTNSEFSVEGARVTENRSGGTGGGMWIRASGESQVTVQDSVLTGNDALAGGGGVYAESTAGATVEFLRSTFVENVTLEELGGGIVMRTTNKGISRIRHSVMRENNANLGGAVGFLSLDGAIEMTSTTIENNSADSHGGGVAILAFGNSQHQVKDSSILSNSSAGNGGGLWIATDSGGTAELVNSTVSGNTSVRSGGGLYASSSLSSPTAVVIRHSTIAFNTSRTLFTSYGSGGGVAATSISRPSQSHTIVSNNREATIPNDLQGSFQGNFNVVQSAGAASLVGSNNVFGVDPLLRPLAMNGGPTATHGIALNSVALNQGDPSVANPPEFDQRGMPFGRIRFGRIDIGALEREVGPSGDFNGDLLYDCADIDALSAAVHSGNYLINFDLNLDQVLDLDDVGLWLAEAGSVNLPSGNPYRFGDANLDGAVDGGDFSIWNANKFTVNSAWCAGDFNADGAVDGGDFSLWNVNKFQSSVLRPPLAVEVSPTSNQSGIGLSHTKKSQVVLDGIWVERKQGNI